MPIYYCQMPQGNVGDEINEIIWPHYLDASKIPEQEYVIGIGSILNHFMPDGQKYTVLSSGIGYGPPPKLTDDWRIIALRGKLSAAALKLGDREDIVLLDGAYLLQDCYELPTPNNKGYIGYIPHVASLDLGDWHSVCQHADLKLLDPRWPADKFLQQLSECEKVMCEAMHGAIFADMLRIPWKPIKAYAHINTEKWDDWLSVFDKTADFSEIQGVWREHSLKGYARVKNKIKKLIYLFTQTKYITPPIYNPSTDRDIATTIEQLEAIKHTVFYLNDQSIIDHKVSLLKHALTSLPYYRHKTPKSKKPQGEVTL